MTPPNKIDFRTLDGVMLRGNFFQAAGSRVPCIVMTQGLTLLKEHYIEDSARRFVAAGISALVYDHRGHGSSDGFPRHQTNPAQQAEDYHDAVTTALSLPGVDPAGICVWGIGHSGGATMIAVADDPRPAAAILNMPCISGARDAHGFPEGVLEAAWRERETATRAASWAPRYVRVWPDSPENARGEGSRRYCVASSLTASSRAASNGRRRPGRLGRIRSRCSLFPTWHAPSRETSRARSSNRAERHVRRRRT